MEVLDKVTIETWILPHLSLGQRGKDIKVDPIALIEAIIYKLKTGCQWRQLPVKQFFDGEKLTWQGVYYHFNEWRKDGSAPAARLETSLVERLAAQQAISGFVEHST
ncbi:transposase [Spirosoma montaniterrae]|uniref:transposase n=1 Tax=Spirosoma montaniterrae TaxID=1178516 RepID=UPI001E2C5135|nr:transposase [Spirosoma montaniterrae]